jgi:hypothetical protein
MAIETIMKAKWYPEDTLNNRDRIISNKTVDSDTRHRPTLRPGLED